MFSDDMRTGRRRLVAGYAVVTLLIVASFAWQMLHGICPVPRLRIAAFPATAQDHVSLSSYRVIGSLHKRRWPRGGSYAAISIPGWGFGAPNGPTNQLRAATTHHGETRHR